MRRFEMESRAVKPKDFDPWYAELGLFGDCEGTCALIGVIMQHAPIECVRYLGAQPGLFAALLTRAIYSDQQRYVVGVLRGRGVGL